MDSRRVLVNQKNQLIGPQGRNHSTNPVPVTRGSEQNSPHSESSEAAREGIPLRKWIWLQLIRTFLEKWKATKITAFLQYGTPRWGGSL